MKNERQRELLKTWVRNSTELMRSLVAKGEADEKNDSAVVSSVMTGCRSLIEAIVNNNLSAQDDQLDPEQAEWVTEFALGLLKKVHPAFEDMAVTIIQAPKGELEEALREHAERFGATVTATRDEDIH